MSKIKKNIEELVAWFILFGAVPFFSVNAFFISIYYYRSAIEIPFVLFLPIIWLCIIRSISYSPAIIFKFSIPTLFTKKSPLTPQAALESLFCYSVLIIFYLAFHYYFDFPKSIKEVGLVSLIGYYYSFILGSFIGIILVVLVLRGLKSLWVELSKIRTFVFRLAATILSYIFMMLFFSGIYRFISIHFPASFNAELQTTTDAIYFSTVTITTLGYGDIIPKSSLAKLIVTTEALVGVFMLVILIGLVISVSIGEKDSTTIRPSRRRHAPISPAKTAAARLSLPLACPDEIPIFWFFVFFAGRSEIWNF